MGFHLTYSPCSGRLCRAVVVVGDVVSAGPRQYPQPTRPHTALHLNIRDKDMTVSKGLVTIVTGRGGALQNGKGGGASEVLPLRKGEGAQTSFRPAIFPFCSPPSP